jgi:hypothetical protein
MTREAQVDRAHSAASARFAQANGAKKRAGSKHGITLLVFIGCPLPVSMLVTPVFELCERV